MINNLFLVWSISSELYYIICVVLTAMVLVGIFLMSKVKTAVLGNRISAIAMLLAIVLIFLKHGYMRKWYLYLSLAAGSFIGLYIAKKIKMIEMPQMVALLNGLGGAASGIVAVFALLKIGASDTLFSTVTSYLAIAIGFITLLGSLVAAGKLHKLLPQKPLVVWGHRVFTSLSFVVLVASVILGILIPQLVVLFIILAVLSSVSFAILFTLRVGGADMPITISLLNSLSGVAGAIAGMAIGDVLLVSIGGIVGASGLLLTQIMCKAMNRRLIDILLGKTTVHEKHHATNVGEKVHPVKEHLEKDPIEILKTAKKVIIVPGYGMAIAQAQHLVKQLADKLVENGASIKYGVHPVAGRMPGHMNVLLAEANVDYDDLYEIHDINPEFKNSDVAIVVGANDVLNPAAKSAEGTPIYGMPILDVEECPNVIIFNYDLNPGYAGVANPLYDKEDGVYLQLGNAAETIKKILEKL